MLVNLRFILNFKWQSFAAILIPQHVFSSYLAHTSVFWASNSPPPHPFTTHSQSDLSCADAAPRDKTLPSPINPAAPVTALFLYRNCRYRNKLLFLFFFFFVTYWLYRANKKKFEIKRKYTDCGAGLCESAIRNKGRKFLFIFSIQHTRLQTSW